ncbi:uncharacterized protein ATNIH1004_005114 [Aspergillus tanneri]|nr:uncharacterized protein ATNIH1004_005114 [Aspergillus tanneri]KAA8649219.1 hypothetical protein ATNIH1004_005114 [Aspergillus tanneri]
MARRPDIVPRHRQPYLFGSEAPTLVKREPVPTTESDSSSTNTCGAGHQKCEKPTSTTTTTTLPVVLGAVVPIVCAILVLIYLHRRNVKKLRNEDANDKHKSLDFGLDMEPTASGKSMRPTEKVEGSYNHAKGVSLDIGPSPYLLPPGLQSSKESIHSLSRSIGGADDKYRSAISYMPGDNAPLRLHQKAFQDDASSFTGSTNRAGLCDDMNQGLLRNAQRMSRSSPPLYETPPAEHFVQSTLPYNKDDTGFQLNLPRSPSPVLIPSAPTSNGKIPTANSVSQATIAIEENEDSSGPGAVHGSLFPNMQSNLADHNTGPRNFDVAPKHIPSPPAQESQHTTSTLDATPSKTTSIPKPIISPLANEFKDEKELPVIPAVNIHTVDGTPTHANGCDRSAAPTAPPEEPSQSQSLKVDPRRSTRRMTLGLRPLPPEDPSDNPEQRANRIRSFYKEYFDENKTGRETYYEDYGAEFYQYDSYTYGPMTGGYDAIPAPFAEPVNRRAMTPPPRPPPRFQGARHMTSGSVSSFSDRLYSPGPRAFSSASGRMTGPLAPRKPAPPPAPLQVLPTPHMLNDDSIMASIDWAPGKTFKDQRDGRPETPLGGLRPFSPTMRAHTPLASAFSELSIIPSPHSLRKSGTYDNLDFAPPPRFKNTETASDSGSIHSNRTGISTTHLHNIRTGAYRVSRLPPETVGTKDDLVSNLRPTWDLRQ